MIDIRDSSDKKQRPLSEMYFFNPSDNLIIENDHIIVESIDGSLMKMFAEEYIVKDIRSRILKEADNIKNNTEIKEKIKPDEVVKLMGLKVIRPWDGKMAMNKYIIASIIPSPNIDMVMEDGGDFKLLISTSMDNPEIQQYLKEIKTLIKEPEPDTSSLVRIKGRMQNIIYRLAQQVVKQTKNQNIQESVNLLEKELNESPFIVGAVGALAVYGGIKAIGAIKKFFTKNKDKKSMKMQSRYTKPKSETSDITVTIGNKSSNKLSHAGIPRPRKGKSISMRSLINELEMKNMFNTEIVFKKNDREIEITTFDKEDIRNVFVYKFKNQTNNYVIIGENGSQWACICLEDCEKVYLIDMDIVDEIEYIPGLESFKLTGADMENGYVSSDIEEFTYDSYSLDFMDTWINGKII